MRVLLLFLVLANAAFLAWTRFYPPQASTEAQLMDQQFNREAIRLLPPAQVAAITLAREQAAKGSACLEWGAISIADLPKAEEALAPLALGDRLSQRRSEETAGWWVFVPPLATRQAAQQKAAELKGLGVEEYFIIADEAKTKFSLSLGVFRSEDAARHRLEELRSQGVRTAQVGRRDTSVQRIYFQVREAGAAVSAKLNELRLAFNGSEVKDCAAPAAAVAAAPSAGAPAAKAAAPAAQADAAKAAAR